MLSWGIDARQETSDRSTEDFTHVIEQFISHGVEMALGLWFLCSQPSLNPSSNDVQIGSEGLAVDIRVRIMGFALGFF